MEEMREEEEQQPVVMTPELQDELLGLLPYETEATVEFTPPCYKRDTFPVALRPVFELRQMKDTTKKKIVEWQKKPSALTDEAVRDMARYHVVGWSNLRNVATNEEIPFESAASDTGAKLALFRMLPQKPVVEILFYLCRMAGIADPDRRGFMS